MYFLVLGFMVTLGVLAAVAAAPVIFAILGFALLLVSVVVAMAVVAGLFWVIRNI